MADLLLELFSEEIPARMQAKAESDLRDALIKGLKEAGVEAEEVTALSGPRRLTVAMTGLPAKSPDVSEEKKGPKVGAPDKAVEGFLRGAGLTSIEEAEVRSDPKKGDFYVALREIPGRALEDILAELVPEIVRGFHWPKSMRWGRGELRWVRPLQRILCLFDGNVVDFEIGGLKSGNLTEGHRVMGRGPFEVSSFEEYKTVLENEGCVVLSREDRRMLIDEQAHVICNERGLELVEDKGLLEEVTGLAEWPVVILGDMDKAFLDLPGEVIRLSMRTHQKYFAVREPGTGHLAPHFVVVANVEASDGGTAIAEGNSRVLSARLNDARFFWDNDRATPLEKMAEKLSAIDFKKELGTIADKVERVAALAGELAPKVGADPDLAARAARLAKADLVSEMVYEFPELQGVMGGYYARAQGEDEAVAAAIETHYKPVGPSDDVPSEPVSIAVALADKLDTLVGFWAIDEKPTGSKDPFALRRAALGVVRIILENEVRLRFTPEFDAMFVTHLWREYGSNAPEQDLAVIEALPGLIRTHGIDIETAVQWAISSFAESTKNPDFGNDVSVPERASTYVAKRDDLLAFFADRLKQYLRDAGARHDLIDAVFALGEDDLVLIVKRVEALAAFLETDDGANLLAGYKRAANILKAEEKKTGETYDGTPDPKLFEQDEEEALGEAIARTVAEADTALKAEDFEAAMAALSTLRAPLDAFFDAVTVNAEREDLRQNRLLVLNSIRDALHRVADFSKVTV